MRTVVYSPSERGSGKGLNSHSLSRLSVAYAHICCAGWMLAPILKADIVSPFNRHPYALP